MSSSSLLLSSWTTRMKLRNSSPCCISSTSRLPSSFDSRYAAIIVNCTRLLNSSVWIMPSSLRSKMLTNCRHCSTEIGCACDELRWTTTGRRSSGPSLPCWLVSRLLNLERHSLANSTLVIASRRCDGRRGTISGRFLLTLSRISSRCSTFFWSVLAAVSACPRRSFCSARHRRRAMCSSMYAKGSSGMLTSRPCSMSWKVLTRSCFSR
mmetsp:Transcript_67925/g.191465  ORF Transcript_67925/g.191465 Transcript_67925/m.191465 type:complete len:209 (+) Transcript_67925:2162-2788(+)